MQLFSCDVRLEIDRHHRNSHEQCSEAEYEPRSFTRGISEIRNLADFQFRQVARDRPESTDVRAGHLLGRDADENDGTEGGHESRDWRALFANTGSDSSNPFS